jgi:hypothetical protein
VYRCPSIGIRCSVPCPSEIQKYPGLKRLNPLFVATIQFKPIASAGLIQPSYSATSSVGAPRVPVIPWANQVAQRDPNLVAARPIAKHAAPKPTHGLYMQVSVMDWKTPPL